MHLKFACPLSLPAMLCALVLPTACETPTAPAAVPYNFKNVAIVAGGYITGIIPHPTAPGLIYLRTDIGGAYRWNPTQKQWTPLTDWISPSDNNLFGIESIATDPTDANKLYLSVGTYDQPWAPKGAVLRSNDQGAHFDITRMPFKMGGNQDGRQAGERLAVDPNEPSVLYIGSRNDGLWKSTDSAKTFSQVTSFPGKSDNKIGVVFEIVDPTSGKPGTPTPAIYAGVSAPTNNLFRSSDAGHTWHPVTGGPAALLPTQARLSDDGWLYIIYGDHPGPNEMKSGAVWKLNLKTGQWKDITPEIPGANGNTTFGYGSVALARPDTVMVSTMDRWNGGDRIYRSTDGGAHWTNIADHAERDDSLSPYLAGADGKVALGHWIGAMAIDPSDPNHAFYGTGATVWATDDLTQIDARKTSHWYVGGKGIEETAVIDLVSPPKGPNLLSGLGDIGCFRHLDLTVSPREGSMKNPQLSNCDSLDFAAANPDLMVRVGGTWGSPSHGGISTDNGATWTNFPTEPAGADKGGQVAIAADGSILLWATRGATFGESTDRGKSWVTTTNFPPHAQVKADRLHPARFYLYDPDAGRLYVGDGPKLKFTATNLELPKSGRMYITPGRADDLWIGTDAGLWHASATAKPPVVKLEGVETSRALGFGAPSAPGGFPTLFLSGKVHGQDGIFRSTDTGQTWLRINDDQHQYGWVGPISGDSRIFGRVYLGTNGRGILVGEPSK
jgi:photosystem II stability/assembly factor-like uncharacterized protein